MGDESRGYSANFTSEPFRVAPNGGTNSSTSYPIRFESTLSTSLNSKLLSGNVFVLNSCRAAENSAPPRRLVDPDHFEVRLDCRHASC